MFYFIQIFKLHSSVLGILVDYWSYRTSASKGNEPGWPVWIGRAWESKPDPDARPAGHPAGQRWITLHNYRFGQGFFWRPVEQFLGAKHLKKPSIWGPDLERAQFGAFFAKKRPDNPGRFSKNALIRTKFAPIRPNTPLLDSPLTSCTVRAQLCQRH